MQTVLIVIHLMIVVALVGVVLLQRSEGGGLGIGGGSGFMTARGAANALTRTTGILAVAFFVTSLGLSLLARYGGQPTDILDLVPEQPAGEGGGVLDQLGGGTTPPANQAAPQAAPATGAAPATDNAATPPAADQATPPAATGQAAPAPSDAATPPATGSGSGQVPNQ